MTQRITFRAMVSDGERGDDYEADVTLTVDDANDNALTLENIELTPEATALRRERAWNQ